MFWLCRTCGVEHGAASGVCAICADERQWVPSGGQLWATLDQLVGEGMRSVVSDIEDGLVAIGSAPALGIGQLGKLVCSGSGNVLWDPSGFVDDDAVAAVADRGRVIAMVASLPTCSVRKSNGAAGWAGCRVRQRRRRPVGDAPDPVIQLWSDTLALTPSLTVVRSAGIPRAARSPAGPTAPTAAACC